MGLTMSNIIVQYRLLNEYNQKKEYEKNLNKNYKLILEEKLLLNEERIKDINERGCNHLVFNINGKVTRLENAQIWHNNGIYVKPKSCKNSLCIIS